jgi:hypothetical protein
MTNLGMVQFSGCEMGTESLRILLIDPPSPKSTLSILALLAPGLAISNCSLLPGKSDHLVDVPERSDSGSGKSRFFLRQQSIANSEENQFGGSVRKSASGEGTWQRPQTVYSISTLLLHIFFQRKE